MRFFFSPQPVVGPEAIAIPVTTRHESLGPKAH